MVSGGGSHMSECKLDGGTDTEKRSATLSPEKPYIFFSVSLIMAL